MILTPVFAGGLKRGSADRWLPYKNRRSELTSHSGWAVAQTGIRHGIALFLVHSPAEDNKALFTRH
jgi:hypothetical protein